MNRRRFLARVGSVLATVGLAPAAGYSKASRRKPNVIFIIADDMKRHMFNCLAEGKGRNLTPHIDMLAAEGTLMMGQHVASPVCTPSRYNCLTGRYASRAQNAGFLKATLQNVQSVVTWNTHILPTDQTLPKMLKQQGYVTGIVGKNHVVEVSGFKKLPYKSDPTTLQAKRVLAGNARKIKAAMKSCGFDYAASIYNNNPDGNGPLALAVHNLDWIVKGGLDFIDENKDKPFFLYFASTIPHGPTTKERSWAADTRITADGILDEPLNVLPPREKLPTRLKAAGIPSSGKENVLWLDDAVGGLIQRLKKHSLYNDTIIFFFNDHGQDAKGTIYQGGVSNPSIVWRKGGFPCGSVNPALVSNIDFAPTILDFAGAELSSGHFDGRSFRPVLEAKVNAIHDTLYFEMGYTRGLRKGKWKYIALRYPERAAWMSASQRRQILERFNEKQKEHSKRIITTDPSAPFSHISLIPGGGGAEAASTGKYTGYYDADQLYDLSLDPGEQKNLADDPKYAEKLQEMKAELVIYLNKLPGSFAD
jgi:arylsulfatase A-like enzyme